MCQDSIVLPPVYFSPFYDCHAYANIVFPYLNWYDKLAIIYNQASVCWSYEFSGVNQETLAFKDWNYYLSASYFAYTRNKEWT
jgi:hypothetical protein